jgi:hypothetical protein
MVYNSLMTNNKFNKEKILEQLQNGVVLVTFTKADGSLRDMKCTLQPRLFPQHTVKEKMNGVKENCDCLKVYDLETDGWRSFKISRLISIFETNE